MNPSKIITGLLLSLVLSMPQTKSMAQEYLVDLNLRGATFTFVDMSDEGNQGQSIHRYGSTFPIAVNIEGVYFFKPHFGAGAFYSRSVQPGSLEYERYIDENDWGYEYGDFDYSMYGITAQVSSGRKRFFQVYGTARIGSAVVVEKLDDYTISSSGLFYSAGIGVMLKITRRISFNLFDVNYTWLPESFSLFNDRKQTALAANSGFSIKLLRKK